MQALDRAVLCLAAIIAPVPPGEPAMGGEARCQPALRLQARAKLVIVPLAPAPVLAGL